jgi:hypothetical protein
MSVIEHKYTKLYGVNSCLKGLQDAHRSDVDVDYSVGDAFENNATIYMVSNQRPVNGATTHSIPVNETVAEQVTGHKSRKRKRSFSVPATTRSYHMRPPPLSCTATILEKNQYGLPSAKSHAKTQTTNGVRFDMPASRQSHPQGSTETGVQRAHQSHSSSEANVQSMDIEPRIPTLPSSPISARSRKAARRKRGKRPHSSPAAGAENIDDPSMTMAGHKHGSIRESMPLPTSPLLPHQQERTTPSMALSNHDDSSYELPDNGAPGTTGMRAEEDHHANNVDEVVVLDSDEKDVARKHQNNAVNGINGVLRIANEQSEHSCDSLSDSESDTGARSLAANLSFKLPIDRSSSANVFSPNTPDLIEALTFPRSSSTGSLTRLSCQPSSSLLSQSAQGRHALARVPTIPSIKDLHLNLSIARRPLFHTMEERELATEHRRTDGLLGSGRTLCLAKPFLQTTNTLLAMESGGFRRSLPSTPSCFAKRKFLDAMSSSSGSASESDSDEDSASEHLKAKTIEFCRQLAPDSTGAMDTVGANTIVRSNSFAHERTTAQKKNKNNHSALLDLARDGKFKRIVEVATHMRALANCCDCGMMWLR